jgi:DNA-binding LacI/PurR family transcriptional regulator
VHDIGETALDLLFGLMGGAEPQSVVLPTKLVIRESCGSKR